MPEEEGFLRIGVRATDGTSNIQPFAPAWNPSGYLWNVVHMIGVNVAKQTATPAKQAPAAKAHGESPAIYRTNCIGCHEDDVITQQRLTRGQWEKEVDKMGRWGSKFKPTDKDAIVDYLASEYPYKKR
jgi:mono/diheme cytochrome c family protein